MCCTTLCTNKHK